jgi:hypothetical protein
VVGAAVVGAEVVVVCGEEQPTISREASNNKASAYQISFGKNCVFSIAAFSS